MGKGSDWTASQELTLLNILKDASVDGNMQNAAPTHIHVARANNTI